MSKNRLIARSTGIALIAVLIGVTVRLTYQINSSRSIEQHPCGQERWVVFNYTERGIRVKGISYQEDGSFQDLEVVLTPNQSSEEAGICHAQEMTTREAKEWFYEGMEMQPGVWMALSTQYTYCVSAEEVSTGEWFQVLCFDELANTE